MVAEVADEVIEAVRTIPAYARPLDGPFGVGLREGVQEAFRHFLGEIEAGGPLPRSDVYVTLGRGEMRAGRSLESLLSAYRLGARVAWRRFAAAGVQAGVEPDTLYLLAESLFAYVDVLSTESSGCWSGSRHPIRASSRPPRRMRTGCFRASWPPWRWPGRGGTPSRRGCPPVPLPTSSARFCARSCPTRRGPGGERRSSAPWMRPGPGEGWGRRWDGPRRD